MKLTTKIPIALLVTFSIATAQESTVEQRLGELEKRVAELEKSLTEKKESPSQKEPVEAKENLIFQDSFESGTAHWDITEKRIIVPFSKGTSQSQKDFQLKKAVFTVCDPWRTTKETTQGGTRIKAPDGKRFLTATSANDGLAKAGTGIMASTGSSKSWRGVRYLIQKEALSTTGMKLPIVTFKAHLHVPEGGVYDKNPQGLFQAGYILEGDSVDQFIPLMTLKKTTQKGWENFELDLSSVPKDKKIKIVFLSMMSDSRFKPSTGLQLDDIKVLDDGE